MANLRDLVDDILALVPQAPTNAAVVAYRKAAREFFADTRAWREYLGEDITVSANVREYTLSPPADAEVIDVLTCAYGDSKMLKRTEDQMIRIYGTDETTSQPDLYRFEIPNKLIVYPTPTADASEVLKNIRVTLQPTRTATTLDDKLVGRYANILEFGALAWLLRQPGQPWTDLTTASVYYAMYDSLAAEWRSRAVDDGMKNVTRVTSYGGY